MLELPDTHRNTTAPGGGALDATGVWINIHTDPSHFESGQPALFLDRDGVINDDVHYLKSPEDVTLLPGITDLIGTANNANVPVVVITNQSGVGRGYLSWDDFAAVQSEITTQLTAHNAHWDMVLACPFHEKAVSPYNVANHPGRKPNPGMIRTAQTTYAIDLSGSWIVGDKAGDVECGLISGLQGGIYAATHEKSLKEEAEAAMCIGTPDYPVIRVDTIRDTLGHVPFLNVL